MISADAPFYFFEGSKAALNTDIAVQYKVNPITEDILCNLIAYAGGADIEFQGEYTFATNLTAVNAKTGAGTNPSDEVLDQVEQVVIDYLDGITENSGISFTN